MSLDEFHALTDKLAGKVKFLYFHLMGEPFLHPLLPEFIHLARKKGFIPVLTTNGTLLSKREEMLESLPPIRYRFLYILTKEIKKRICLNTFMR